MQRKAFFIIPLFLIFLVGFAPAAMAISTSACHCFKNRTYNPADRFVSDDYILATSFNSLLAKAYGIAKKQIVLLKMKGGAEHLDLIVALEVEKKTGTDLGQLLALRKQQPWQKILNTAGIFGKIGTDGLLSALAAGDSIDKIGPRLADRLLSRFYGVELTEIARLRESGLHEKEMALVLILAFTHKMEPALLAEKYLKEGKSWSEIAHELGVTPAEAGKLILSFTN